MQNVTSPDKTSLPKEGKRLSTKEFQEQIKRQKTQLNARFERETNLAWHSIKVFCIRNLIWLIVLIVFFILALIIDIFTVFCVWKNPAMFFIQLKTLFVWIISFILGGVAEHLRNKIINKKHT